MNPSLDKNYYVWRSGHPSGPFTQTKILSLAEEGEISDETLCYEVLAIAEGSHQLPPVRDLAWKPIRVFLPEVLQVHKAKAVVAKPSPKQIYLAKPTGEKTGPFTFPELRWQIRDGVISDEDYWGWFEGLNAWMRLYDLMALEFARANPPPAATAAPATPARRKVGGPTRDESIRWYCYRDEHVARRVFEVFRKGPLGGPGRVELRRNSKQPIGWWVVTYNILMAYNYSLPSVFCVPKADESDSWFPYEGQGIVNERTDVSYLIELFSVEPNVEGLRKALREMGDGYYNCEPNVSTATEAKRRLKEYFDLEA